MASGPELLSRYYFVPLERRRSAYLEMLGLPANADPNATGKRKNEFLKELEKKRKEKTKELKKQFEEGKATKEELEAATEKLKEEDNEAQLKLVKLKELHEKLESEQRGKARLNSGDASLGWMDLEPWRLDPAEADNASLLDRRPLPMTPKETLAKLRSLLNGQPGQPWPEAWPTGLENQETLPDFLGLAGQATSLPLAGRLLALATADALWEQVEFTNRAYWRGRLISWAGKLSSGVSALGLAGQPSAPEDEPPPYPSLCRFSDLSLGSLQGEGLEQALPASVPRRASQPDADLAARFLAELLGRPLDQAGGDANDPGQEPSRRSGPLALDMDVLAELLRRLEQDMEPDRERGRE